MGEVVELEDAHRAVPEDGLGGLDGVGVELLGLGADVHALTVVGDGVGGDDLRYGVLAKVVGNAVVDREEDLDALLLGLLQHLAGALDPVLLLEGHADGHALGEEEGVGHAATDDEGVGGVDQVIEDADLGGHLGAADDGDEGTLGLGEDRGQGVDLLLEQEAGVGGQVGGGADHGALGAVGGAEGVEHEDVAVGRERLGDLGVVLLLALVEADVLEDEDLAILEGVDGGLGLLAVGVVDELHVIAGNLGELVGGRLEGELGLGAVALGAAEVAHEDDLGALVLEVLDGRDGGAHAGVVGHDAVLQRHVEVDAHEDALARDVGVAHGLLGESHVHSLELGTLQEGVRPRPCELRPHPS